MILELIKQRWGFILGFNTFEISYETSEEWIRLYFFRPQRNKCKKDFTGQAGFTGLTAPVKCGSAEIGSDPEQ